MLAFARTTPAPRSRLHSEGGGDEGDEEKERCAGVGGFARRRAMLAFARTTPAPRSRLHSEGGGDEGDEEKEPRQLRPQRSARSPSFHGDRFADRHVRTVPQGAEVRQL